MIGEWGDAAVTTFGYGLAAFVWFAIAKLLAAQYGQYIPAPLRDLIALV